jgi:hypothetical protein
MLDQIARHSRLGLSSRMASPGKSKLLARPNNRGGLQFRRVQTIIDLLQEALNFFGIV